MHLLILAVLLLALVFGPSLWVQWVMRRYQAPENRYPGTGAELARHLARRLALNDVTVEETDGGDHYDPSDKTVRLSSRNYHGRSLTAVTVAAHEVGHALQHGDGYRPLQFRTQLVEGSALLQKLGAGMLMAAPFVALLTRAIPSSALLFLGGLLSLGTATVVHLATLPVEFDASFGRALPIMEQGGYLKPEDRPHARRLLRAAALSYVAASLMSLLNIARWWAILRR